MRASTRRANILAVGLVGFFVAGAVLFGQSNSARESAEEQRNTDGKSNGTEASLTLEQLQSMALDLVMKPPSAKSPGEVDKELADLRWKIARQLAQTDIEGAIAYARASLRLVETVPGRWEQLGDLYVLSGKAGSARDAIVAFDNVLFLDPARRNARLKLACAYMMNQQISESLKHLEFYLCQTVDEEEQLQASRVYVSACAMGNQAKRGIAFCEAMSAEPDNAACQIAWAILEKSLGKQEKAVGLLEGVIEREGISAMLSTTAEDLRKLYSSVEGEMK